MTPQLTAAQPLTPTTARSAVEARVAQRQQPGPGNQTSAGAPHVIIHDRDPRPGEAVEIHRRDWPRAAKSFSHAPGFLG
jgi:hypothetical protein